MTVSLFVPRRVEPAAGPGDAGPSPDAPTTKDLTERDSANAARRKGRAPNDRGGAAGQGSARRTEPALKAEMHSYAREAAALVLLASALYTTLALGSFQGDPLRPEIAGADWVGPVGAELAGGVVGAVGVVAWFIPLELALLAAPLLNGKPTNASVFRFSGDVVVTAVLAALAHVSSPHTTAFGSMPIGGSVGELFGEILRVLFSTVGSYIIGATVVGLILVGRATFSFIELANRIERGAADLGRRVMAWLRALARAWTTARDLEQSGRADEPSCVSEPIIAAPVSSPDAIIAALADSEEVTPAPRPAPSTLRGVMPASIIEWPTRTPLAPVSTGPVIEWSETALAWKPDAHFSEPGSPTPTPALAAAPSPATSAAPAPAPRREKRPRSETSASAKKAPEIVSAPAAIEAPIVVPSAATDLRRDAVTPEPPIDARDDERDEPAKEELVLAPTPQSAAFAVSEVRTNAPAPAPAPANEAPMKRARPQDLKIVDTTTALAPEKAEVVRVVPAVGQGFRLPSLDMLEASAGGRFIIDEQQLKATAQLLEKTLADYGVSGKAEEIHPGPTVTTFEVSPAAGTKVSKVAGLADDLALGLSKKVRIVAPIPGKNRIGFEIPNEQRVPVNLRELIEDRRFMEMNAPLPCVLGRDIIGAPYFADLASMPHVIVAGATGAGKSVGLNVMLVSLLFRKTPEDLRLLMIDPKVVELAPFDRIPHMLLPVVTDMKQAANALKWAVDEMERRYQLFANAGTKNITTYNAWVAKVHRGEARPPRPPAKVSAVGADGLEVEVPAAKDGSDAALPEKIPFIVIVVDEFADLMMQQGKDVEASVARLAQKARAAGMHVILATQRPSVDVITGMIKANFPTRIAFRVAQKVDSRTILDEQGAEHLLGRGDMLVKMNGSNDTRRVQCPFCSEEEVQRITDFLRLQGEPVYDEAILKPRDEDGEEAADTSDAEADPMYDAAVRIVADTRRCSTSWIQRKLGVGYNRAAKIVEAMEKHGLVGPANGAKDREVLISPL